MLKNWLVDLNVENNIEHIITHNSSYIMEFFYDKVIYITRENKRRANTGKEVWLINNIWVFKKGEQGNRHSFTYENIHLIPLTHEDFSL